MLSNAHKSLAVVALLGLSTLFLGFGWSMQDIGYLSGDEGPTITAPDTTKPGKDIVVEATAEDPGIRVVVTDADGNEIYNSDEDPNAQEQPGSDGDSVTLSAIVHIPAHIQGSVTITAQDGAGRVSTKTVSVNAN